MPRRKYVKHDRSPQIWIVIYPTLERMFYYCSGKVKHGEVVHAEGDRQAGTCG